VGDSKVLRCYDKFARVQERYVRRGRPRVNGKAYQARDNAQWQIETFPHSWRRMAARSFNLCQQSVH
jgi:hypothetical protein